MAKLELQNVETGEKITDVEIDTARVWQEDEAYFVDKFRAAGINAYDAFIDIRGGNSEQRLLVIDVYDVQGNYMDVELRGWISNGFAE